jgi:hypothetical protein
MKQLGICLGMVLAGLAVGAVKAQEASPPQAQQDLLEVDLELARLKVSQAEAATANATKESAKRLPTRLCATDQWLRTRLNLPWEHGYGGTKEGARVKAALVARMNAVDAENTRLLKGLLDHWGWFKRSSWGHQADKEAWLLALHADGDLPFQKQVLKLLSPLWSSGETDSANYALLFDRVSVNEGRPQRYGTQGRCTGVGRWAPRPTEAPDHLDGRRRAMGLPPEAEYIAHMNGYCHQDETPADSGPKT